MTTALTELLNKSDHIRHLSLGISERRVLLIIGDFLILFSSSIIALLGWAIWRQDIEFNVDFVIHHFGWLIVLPLAWFILSVLYGSYDLKVAAHFHDISRRVVGIWITFISAYLTLFFITVNQPNSVHYPFLFGQIRLLRVVPVLFLFVSLILILTWRNVYAQFFTRSHFQRRVLILGAGYSGRTISSVFQDTSHANTYKVIGFIDDNPAKIGISIGNLPVLGSHIDLVFLVRRLSIDELVLSISHQLQDGVFEAILECFEHGVQIVPMPVMYERLTGRVPVEHIGDHWYVSPPLSSTPPGKLYRITERLMDIIGACLGLVFLGAIIPFVWFGNRIWSPGPLFYWQTRVGRAGKHYRMVKFRTMVPDAERNSGAVWAKENDPRITPFGRFLRKSRLDEIPQFWNVLKGEMSLIGPRPERPEFIEKLAGEIPFYRSRLAVKPGLTGWAQVKYRYGSSIEDTLIKLQYDLYYIKYRSVWLNLQIVLKTIATIATFQGR